MSSSLNIVSIKQLCVMAGGAEASNGKGLGTSQMRYLGTGGAETVYFHYDSLHRLTAADALGKASTFNEYFVQRRTR